MARRSPTRPGCARIRIAGSTSASITGRSPSAARSARASNRLGCGALHVLPQLRKLERKWSRELVVVGVHSPKFSSERETEALRAAVLRLDLSHPVVNDRDFRVWQSYA